MFYEQQNMAADVYSQLDSHAQTLDTFLKHAHALVYNTTLYYEFIMQADEE